MGSLWNDIKHSVHMFIKNPGFAIAAVAALALGIGANTAIFTVVNAVLLKPLSYPDADRIVAFLLTSPDGNNPIGSIPKFHIWQQQTSVFKEVAAFDFAGPGFNITGDRPEQIHGIHVTEGYFRLFGAPVMLGRTFTPQEDAPNGGKVVVLSYGLWQRKFGGDPKVIGNALSLGNEPFTIIGILGQDFLSDPEADIWLPFQFEPNSTNQGHYFQAAGLLKPGVTLAQANAQMKLAARQYLRAYTSADPQQSFAAQPLRDTVVGDVRKSLLILLGAVGMVLLIACANVANLLLVRATMRRREIAIRAAMGAGRGRIIRQLLTESVLLSLGGGVLGLALGYFGVRALLTINPGNIPRIGEQGAAITLDWRVLAFTLLVSLATGILFGLIPAFSASHADLGLTLKGSGSRSGSSLGQNKARATLIVTEVALALVLLVGAALLIRTFAALRGVDPGFSTDKILTMEMSLTGSRYETSATVNQLVRDAQRRVESLPGVVAFASTCCLPLEGGFGLPFIIEGRPLTDGPAHGGAGYRPLSPRYFDVFKIPLLRGRMLTDHDDSGSELVVLINEGMAKKYWQDANPVGQRITIGKGVGPEFEEPAREIVGIVGDVRNGGLDSDPDEIMYVPVAQMTNGQTALNNRIIPITWIVRPKVEPFSLSTEIQEQLRTASGGLPVSHIRSMDQVRSESTQRTDFNMTLLVSFAGVALLLAAIGIYGLMAYSVQLRTQEIGIRMALGAGPQDVRRMVVKQGMRLALLGVFLGLAAALALTRLMASLLYGVKPWDPAAIVSVAVLLSAVALLATYFPARRASRVDPMIALRYE